MPSFFRSIAETKYYFSPGSATSPDKESNSPQDSAHSHETEDFSTLNDSNRSKFNFALALHALAILAMILI